MAALAHGKWNDKMNTIANCLLYILALACGALYPLAFAPVNVWPLLIVSIAGFLWLLELTQNPKSAFLLGWCYGVGLFGVGVSWIFVSIYEYGYMPFVVSVIMTAGFVLFLALFFAFLAWVYFNWPPYKVPKALYFAALWVLLEWVRIWIFSVGFPWLFAGYAFIDTAISGYAPIVGALGLSFIVVLCAGILAACLSRKQAWLKSVLLIVSIWFLGSVLSMVQWVRPDVSRWIDVHLVQGNIPQEEKWIPENRPKILQHYETLSRNIWQQQPESTQHLLIWPEAAVPSFWHESWEFIEQFNDQAKEQNAGWIAGVPWVEVQGGEATLFNGIIAQGVGSGAYAKQKLVPFGEFVPFSGFLRKLGPFFNLPMSSFTKGDENQEFLLAQGYRIAPFICYEIVYPELVREYSKDVDILLTVSNDGWFGGSFGPDQHFEMARMRALEMGKMLVRATNNGVTGIADHVGKTVEVLPKFEQAVLSGQVTAMIGKTPYSIMGLLPVVGLCASILVLSFVLTVKKTFSKYIAVKIQLRQTV